MKITWLSNSGYAIEKDGHFLLIDCHDPEKHPLLRKLSGYSSVTVLASHVHGDHYSPEIFRLSGDPAFVLSFDIPKREKAVSLRSGENCTVNGMNIQAFGSTDEGISFLIRWPDGTSLFHAGDLNNRHWREEGDENWTKTMDEEFHRELAILEKEIAPNSLTVACFPVDPRMGTDYYRGAVEFAAAIRPKAFLPMHFGGKFDPPQAFFEEMKAFTEVHSPHTPFTV